MNTLNTLIKASLVLAISLPLAACGGGTGGGAACSSTFTACGGSVVGTWKYQQDCNPGPLTDSTCPTATFSGVPALGATATFTSSGYTLTQTFNANSKFSETLPASCLSGSGATSCSQLNNSQPLGGTAMVTFTCTGTITVSCTCVATFSGTLTDTGTYSTAGTNITLTSSASGSTPVTAGYCVKGGELDLNAALSAGMSANTYSQFFKQ